MDATTQPPLAYRYEPLEHPDSIRVLVLQAASLFDSELRCSMIQYSRREQLQNTDTSQHYSAVSYTWGQPDFSLDLAIDPGSADTDSHHSPVDNTSTHSFLKITPTVDSILRHLRKPHRPVYLWLDALCIDQQDEKDKATQIPQMGEIYQCAERVHVWLGDADADEVGEIFANIRRMPIDRWDDLSKSLSILLNKTWFSRRWIVQELILAQQAIFHCGKHSLDLQRFLSAWNLVLRRRNQLETQADVNHSDTLLTLVHRSMSSKKQDQQDILELLWGFHRSECSDPRDRIAALYGLISTANHPIDLEYDRHDWRDLYYRLAKGLIEKSPSSAFRVMVHLAAFGPAAGRIADDPVYPSWVPDWSGTRQPGLASYDVSKTSRMDKPWVNTSLKELKSYRWTLPPELDRDVTNKLSSKEKGNLWRQEAEQDIPWRLIDPEDKSIREFDHITRIFPRNKELRVSWSPLRGGLYGKSVRLILKLPQESVEDRNLCKLVIECLKTIQSQFEGGKSIRIVSLLAAALTGRLSHELLEDLSPEESFQALLGMVTEAVEVGFRNLESLDQIHSHTLKGIGTLLQQFALVQLVPLVFPKISRNRIPLTNEGDLESSEDKIRERQRLRRKGAAEFGEYALGPHDIACGDIAIPFDAAGMDTDGIEWRRNTLGNIPSIYTYSALDKDMPSDAGLGAVNLFEVTLCLRPTSQKQVYETSGSHSTFSKFTSKLSGSKDMYRDLQDGREYVYPPQQVRKARFIGPMHCVTSNDVPLVRNEKHLGWLREEYVKAREAGFCRPVTIDIV